MLFNKIASIYSKYQLRWNHDMIKDIILKSNIWFIQELRGSIKDIEIEENFDLLVQRPLGLLFTFLFISLNITPLTVSLLSMILGIFSGVFFMMQDYIYFALIGSLLLILAGILDSSDGQLARLTNSSSKYGMIIDGFIDTIVFFAAYLGCSIYLYPKYGVWVFLLSIVSGFLHSVQSMLYDYQKNEFSYLVAHKTCYRNPTTEETKQCLNSKTTIWHRLLDYLYLDYVMKQNWFNTRKGSIKQKFESVSCDERQKAKFSQSYKMTYLPLLSWWALLGGTNTHRTLIIIFCLFKHFEYYLVINVFLTLPTLMLVLIQYRIDLAFLKEFGYRNEHL